MISKNKSVCQRESHDGGFLDWMYAHLKDKNAGAKITDSQQPGTARKKQTTQASTVRLLKEISGMFRVSGWVKYTIIE